MRLLADKRVCRSSGRLEKTVRLYISNNYLYLWATWAGESPPECSTKWSNNCLHMHCRILVQLVPYWPLRQRKQLIVRRRSIAGYSGLSSPFCLSMYLGFWCNVSRSIANNSNKISKMSSCLLSQMYSQLSKSGESNAQRASLFLHGV